MGQAIIVRTALVDYRGARCSRRGTDPTAEATDEPGLQQPADADCDTKEGPYDPKSQAEVIPDYDA